MAGAECAVEAFVDAGTLLLSSLRKDEKADDERSMRVRSVSRVFSDFRASFSVRRSSASLVLVAISPSSWPMYSVKRLAYCYVWKTMCSLPFRLDRKALADTLFLS